jgi:hypothetical protein
MSSLEHHGGSVKREAEATHGMGGGIGAMCGMGWGAEAACGTVTCYEVPTIEEG